LSCLVLTVLTAQAQDLAQERGETTINLNQTGINFLSDDAMQNIDGGYFFEINIDHFKYAKPDKEIKKIAMHYVYNEVMADLHDAIKALKVKESKGEISREQANERYKSTQALALYRIKCISTAMTDPNKAYNLVVGGGTQNNQYYIVAVKPNKDGRTATEIRGTRFVFAK